MNINGYSLFRRDRQGRKGGGVAVYARHSLAITEWPTPQLDPVYELLWLKTVCNSDVTFIGALYHRPTPLYQTETLLDLIVSQFNYDFPGSHVILAGDLNTLSEFEIIARTGLSPIVFQPTRGNNKLDRIYVSDLQYLNVKVVKSTVKSDHQAIIAFNGETKQTLSKTKRECHIRKRTPAQHANFLRSVVDPVHTVDPHGDTQQEFDALYASLIQLLDTYYPLRSITIASSDQPYVTPFVKHLLRRKNKLMRSGRTDEAAALAGKIGDAIKRYSIAELCRVDVVADARSMWAKVRQLTGRSKSSREDTDSSITADRLNNHYASISTDAGYQAPSVKHTANSRYTGTHISEWRMFDILDHLKDTAEGLDGIPAWFLRVGAPFFAAPIADIMNLSLATSVVPVQWKKASILPIAKISVPQTPADFRPISITPVLSRILERIVVKEFIYPSLQSPPSNLNFSDQFAFQPTASTTAALIFISVNN